MIENQPNVGAMVIEEQSQTGKRKSAIVDGVRKSVVHTSQYED
jgi:hypothetical protein